MNKGRECFYFFFKYFKAKLDNKYVYIHINSKMVRNIFQYIIY